MPRLEKWTIRDLNSYSTDFYLLGYIYDDTRFEDGCLIHTSLVEELDLDKGCAITRSGTHYELGQRLVGDHYESEWYDD